MLFCKEFYLEQFTRLFSKMAGYGFVVKKARCGNSTVIDDQNFFHAIAG